MDEIRTIEFHLRWLVNEWLTLILMAIFFIAGAIYQRDVYYGSAMDLADIALVSVVMFAIMIFIDVSYDWHICRQEMFDRPWFGSMQCQCHYGDMEIELYRKELE